MRRKFLCEIGFSLFVVLVAMESAALAQTINPPVVKPPVKVQAPVTPVPTPPAKAEVFQALKSAHQLLSEANHDYDGHRAKADQEVHKALKDLGYHHKKGEPGSAPKDGPAAAKKAAPASQPATHEAQATSDEQLRQARHLLRGVLSQLGSSHPHAAGHVKAAIHEIDRALTVR